MNEINVAKDWNLMVSWILKHIPSMIRYSLRNYAHAVDYDYDPKPSSTNRSTLLKKLDLSFALFA